MSYTSIIALLKTALLLLTLAQGPNVPASLKTQATSVANQAIAAATQALAAQPKSTATSTVVIVTPSPSPNPTPNPAPTPPTPVPQPTPAVTYASLNAAVSAIGSTPSTLVISKPLPASGTLVVPSTLTISIVAGGSIVGAAATRIQFNGPFVASASWVFSGFMPGDISLAKGSAAEVRPEWWGMNSSSEPLVNASAVQSAILSSLGGVKVKLGAGTFVVAGSGKPGNLNGAAIIMNRKNNPAGLPVTIEGSGVGVTILKLAASNPFNILEVINGLDNTSATMPVTIQDLSFDGNSDNEQQQMAGDRYQNGIYLMNVNGVTVRRVDIYGASYHGFHANALSSSNVSASVHENTGDGVVLTGNEAQALYGVGTHYRFVATNNGIPRLTNVDMPMDQNGTKLSPCDPNLHICDVDTYHGVYAALQRNVSLEVTTSGQRFNQGLEIGRMQNSTIILSSDHDYQGALAFDGGVLNNAITADIKNGGTALRDLGNGGDVSNSPGIVSGNTISLTAVNNGQVGNLGSSRGTFENNTITGRFVDLMRPAQGALMVIGPNFRGNTIQNFTAGDQQGAGNVAFIVQAYPNTGGKNIFRNGTLIGKITSTPFAGLSPTDVVQNVQ